MQGSCTKDNIVWAKGEKYSCCCCCCGKVIFNTENVYKCVEVFDQDEEWTVVLTIMLESNNI